MNDLRSDQELALRAAEGDEPSWKRIYEGTCDRLFAFLCYQVGDRDEARDLLQETYLQAFRRLNRYRGEAPLGAWLRAIALSKALDWKRRMLKRIKRSDALTEASLVADCDPPEVRFESEKRALAEAIASLSPLQRAALLLREWDGWDFREIARALRCKESTARVHHTRARRRLLERMNPQPSTVATEGLEGRRT
jgi:RNA polymerase sigma-70 factor (ECF subfamily)